MLYRGTVDFRYKPNKYTGVPSLLGLELSLF